MSRNRTPPGSTRCGGFSLVELMIALVLGLFLVGGTITVFSSGIRTSEFNQSLANLQANARFALSRMSDDVRLAGFQGCSGLSHSQLSIQTSPAPTDNYERTAIWGAVVGDSGWTPALPTGYTAPTGVGAPLQDSHALMVQYAAGPGAVVSSSLGSTIGSISLSDGEPVRDVVSGDLMVISDCSSADLFKVQTITTTGVASITPADALSKTYALQSATDNTLRVMPFFTAIYYVGDTQRTNDSGDRVYALYMQRYPHDLTNNPPIELIEGVDQMQLLFGTRRSDGRVEFLAPDDADFAPENIQSVDIGLLLSSYQRYPEVDKDRVYTLTGRAVLPASAAGSEAPRYPADQRMRVAFTKSVSVRNRALEND